MAKQGITTGSAPNDGTGDTLLAGAVKINSNFDELYTYLGNGSNLSYIGGRWSNTNVGISTLSNVGIGTTNPTSALTVTGDGKVTGVVTATTFIGGLTGAVTGNVVGNLTGNVTGTASTAQGLTGTPTISVADVTASGKVSAGGSVTGATIHGSGNALTGIVTYINPGTNISVSANQGYVTINASSSGGQGYFSQNATGINTSSNVGIGTTTADHTLTVAGVTSTTNLSVTGLSTFSGKMEGAAVNNVIPFYYDNVNEFPSASTYHGAFAHAHNTGRAYFAHAGWKELVNVEANGIVGTGTEKFNIGITSVTALTATTVSASSTITATNFVGDGSGLTGVTASGTGIIIKNNGSAVGTAGTIDFGTALSVSAVSGAAVTVTASTPNNLTPATLVVSGVTTATGGVVGNLTGNVVGNVTGTASTATVAVNAQGLTGTPNISVGTINASGAITGNVTGNVVGNVTGTATTATNATQLLGSRTIGGVVFDNTGDINLPGVNAGGNQNTSGTAAGLSGNPSISVSGITNSGNSTASSFRSTDVNGSGSAVGLAIKYYVSSNGSSSYRFAGPGILNTTDDPTLYLHRGFTYIFENSTGGSHPFRIQFTGTTTGVGTFISGSNTGTQIFTIPHDAPANYEYQCTIHSGMKGSFIIPS